MRDEEASQILKQVFDKNKAHKKMVKKLRKKLRPPFGDASDFTAGDDGSGPAGADAERVRGRARVSAQVCYFSSLLCGRLFAQEEPRAQPRGRPPKNKEWNGSEWVLKKQPRGRPPKNKEWNGSEWVDEQSPKRRKR